MDVLVEGVSYKPLARKTMLLIEDENAVAFWLGEMFAKAGYQVFVASSCETALKFMRSCKPNLILLNERQLMSHGIDLGYRLSIMKDLQEIPLLLINADFH
jgi:response regulator RpfG family c-di-GMP phosphodiesterase